MTREEINEHIQAELAARQQQQQIDQEARREDELNIARKIQCGLFDLWPNEIPDPQGLAGKRLVTDPLPWEENQQPESLVNRLSKDIWDKTEEV